MICRCGHSHEDHGKSRSINYTHGKCEKCVCKNFVIQDEYKDCNDCPSINMTEKEQDEQLYKGFHYCMKLKKHLKHNGNHPRLIPPDACPRRKRE